jgi:hypothetical protein
MPSDVWRDACEGERVQLSALSSEGAVIVIPEINAGRNGRLL